MRLVKVPNINKNQVLELERILNTDTKLRASLGIKNECHDFLGHTLKWMQDTNSITYVIIDDSPLGLISISHIKDGEARIGYWLASAYWNMGITSMAFERILSKARWMGIVKVSGTIKFDNANSLAIWKKFGASIAENNEGFHASIFL